MIATFKNKEIEKVFKQIYSKHYPNNIQKIALRKLMMINAADSLNDLKTPPGNYLEKLYGDRQGQYSIRINNKYRICFRYDEGYFLDVEIVDYH